MSTDEPYEPDDEATLAASDDALDEIRAEAARVRSEQAAAFDPSEDPTTVIVDLDNDLAEEPTVITNFDPAEDPTVISFDADDPTTTAAFDAAEDPTTVMTKFAEDAAKSPANPAKNPPGASLIDGKAPPEASATYWDRNELAAESQPKAAAGKGPVPKWFIATSLLAVLMACGLVLLVLWALSGSS